MSVVPEAPEVPEAGSGALQALETAIDQSHEVKAKIEACADELAANNQLAQAQIANGATTLPAEQALQEGVAVERQVQEVAGDLQQVNEQLSQGLGEVQEVELALSRSRQALEDSKTALASSIEAERSASWRAMHDGKTGLPNRSLFDDRLAQAIAGAERHGWMLAVMFLDLDRFKAINDSHGHAAGDAVLTTIAQRLLSHARDEDTVCRNGGDEFLYLLINPSGRDNTRRIATLVRETIMQPIQYGALSLVIEPSIGIALYPDHATDMETLIARADAAMYVAKQQGTACEFFVAPAP
jgi:diguanylate cyclase (GGDEF)-like protein